jgi:hypothetical protein
MTLVRRDNAIFTRHSPQLPSFFVLSPAIEADRDQDRAAKTLDKTGERETCVSRRPRCEALVLCERPAVPSDQLQSAMLALRGPIARLPRCQPLQVAGSILMRLAGPQAAQLSHVVRRQTSTDLATQRASPSLLLLGMVTGRSRRLNSEADVTF